MPIAKSKLTTVWTETTSGRREAGQKQIRRLVAVPVRAEPRQPSEAESRRRVATIFVLALIASVARSGIQPDVPEEQRDGGVGRDGEDVPDERAAELRPEPHRVRIREQPVGRPRGARRGYRGRGRRRTTAKSVMASAKRLMELRHFWRKKKRMAEISVPAWPMPIHQTKLTMSKPQPTGMLMPQMPTPLEEPADRAGSSTSRTGQRRSRSPIQPGFRGVRLGEDDRGDLVRDGA